MCNPNVVKEDLQSVLSTRVVTVTFRKVNGELRIMDCTKNLEFVPPSMWPKAKLVAEEDRATSSALRVYDVKAQAWRSFLAGNVLSWV